MHEPAGMKRFSVLWVLLCCSACFVPASQGDGGLGGGQGTDGGVATGGGSAGGGAGGGSATGGGSSTGGGSATGGGVGTGGGSGAACSNLNASQCEVRPDCMPIYCQQCGCDFIFTQCKGPNDMATPCPQLGCPQPVCCRSAADCDNTNLVCAPPGTPPGCGACNTDPGNCQSDSQCAAGQICEPIPCSCGAGPLPAKRCVAGCTQAADCRAGEVCSGHRCAPQPCAGPADCPVSFACLNDFCARKTCSNDGQCSARGSSVCLDGQCYLGEGQCMGPVP